MKTMVFIPVFRPSLSDNLGLIKICGILSSFDNNRHLSLRSHSKLDCGICLAFREKYQIEAESASFYLMFQWMLRKKDIFLILLDYLPAIAEKRHCRPYLVKGLSLAQMY